MYPPVGVLHKHLEAFYMIFPINSKFIRARHASVLRVTLSDGSVKQFTTKELDRKKAAQILNNRLALWMEKGQGGKDYTVGQAWELFLLDYAKRVRPTSYNQIKSRGKAHLSPLFPRKLCTIRPVDFQRVIDNAAAHTARSPKTITGIILVIRKFTTFCTASGWLDPLPNVYHMPLGLHKRQKRPLSRDGVRLLFSESSDFYIHCFRFLYLTGLRRGEFCALQYQRDFVGGLLYVRESISHEGITTSGKTDNAQRVIPVTGQALKELEAHRLQAPPGVFLFCDRDGRQIQPRHLRNRWQRWQEKNGLQPISLHELRHSYISNAYNTGAGTLDEIKRLVGHSIAFNTVAQYVHDTNTPEEQARQLIKIAETLDDALAEIGRSASDNL